MTAKIRTIEHKQVGSAPFSVFFQKEYLLVVVRVANRTDLSNYYTERVLTPYELGVAGYTNFVYDKSKINQPGTREFTETSVITDSFPVGQEVTYVITYLEFDNLN